MPTEAEEKRAILKKLRDYRESNGPGCLDAVAKATRSRGRISDSTLREILINAERIPIGDWRKIGRALAMLKGKEQTHDAYMER